MNQTLKFTILLILTTLPALTLLLKTGVYPSHDSLYHVLRIREFHSSFELGQIPPRLAPNILNSIGYPLFVVNYQLPYYISLIPMFIFNDLILSYETVMAFGYIAGNMLMFLTLRNHFSPIASYAGSIIFAYAPYRFANLYTRGAIGESTAVALVPMVLHALSKLKKDSKYSVTLIAASVFLIITAHTVIFLMFIPFFIAYSIFFLKLNKKQFMTELKAVTLGISLSAFQFIPSIVEKKYMKFDESLEMIFRSHFISTLQLFRVPAEGINIGTTTQIGLTLTAVLILSVIFIKKDLKILLFLLLSGFGFFLVIPSSEPLWNSGFLVYAIYPWRFISYVVFATAFLAALILTHSKFKVMLAVFIVLTSMITSRHYFTKPSIFEAILPSKNLTSQNEHDPIWSNNNTFEQRALISTSGDAQITSLTAKPFKIEAEVKTNDPAEINFRKLYFPGWHLTVNGQQGEIFTHGGLISSNIPAGNNYLVLNYTESTIRKISNLITILSLLLLTYLFSKARKT